MENEITEGNTPHCKFEKILKDCIDNDKSLKIKFIKITNDEERTAEYAIHAPKKYYLNYNVNVKSNTLKTITKEHDRVFEKDKHYTGTLLTFPERISGNENGEGVHHDAGESWQWRRLYVQQILTIEVDGKVIAEKTKEDAFNFDLADSDEKERYIVPYEEIKKEEERKANEIKNKQKWERLKAEAKRIAAGMSKEEAMKKFETFHHMANDGIDDPTTLAILNKHEELSKQFPNEHEMHDTEGPDNNRRGFYNYKCKCGFQHGWDSSD